MFVSRLVKGIVLSLSIGIIPNIAFAEKSIVCPSLEKAAEKAKFSANHFGGNQWEIDTGSGVFYVEVSYKVCLYRMIANLSGAISGLEKAPEDWKKPNRIGSFFEQKGKVFMKHTVILPDGLLDTLSWNLKIFDDLSSRAYHEASAVSLSKSKKGI
jgi:hypothetical protein